MKLAIKIPDHILPVLATLGYVIKFFFYLGGKRVIDYIREMLYQKVIHYHSDIGREKLVFISSCNFSFFCF